MTSDTFMMFRERMAERSAEPSKPSSETGPFVNLLPLDETRRGTLQCGPRGQPDREAVPVQEAGRAGTRATSAPAGSGAREGTGTSPPRSQKWAVGSPEGTYTKDVKAFFRSFN
jgi:hypothetical protein